MRLDELAHPETFERCQQGDTITKSDGEAGYGVYAYPVRYARALRPYYLQGEGGKDGADRNVFHLTLKSGYVVDLTKPEIMRELLAYARQQFARMKERMTYYQTPKVDARSIQRFGSTIEDFVRDNYPDASGYTVAHQFLDHIPKGKQTVITKLENFEVTQVA